MKGINVNNNLLFNVQILMSTYNGELYLREQINSLLLQKKVNINILVRDDGSTDGTIEILQEYANKGVLKYYIGENIGPAHSFMELLYGSCNADYYAFCDQDDVWDSDKLITAIENIDLEELDKPALYFSSTRLVDRNLQFIRNSKLKTTISLGSSLIINPAAGCTQVFNYSLMKLLRRQVNANNIGMHDAWIYRVCASFNGKIIFDKKSHISYRQHGNNVIGGLSNPVKKYKRRINSLINKKNPRQKSATELLRVYGNEIPKESLVKIKKVVNYKNSVQNKISLLLDSSIKTKNLEYDISFYLAVIFNAF